MKKVMVVEDDKALLNIYRKMIGVKYWVEGVADGEAAVEKLKKYLPDLLFLDLEMPKLDGLGVLKVMKKKGWLAKVPVVILSNYSNPEVIDRALAMGARGYVKKEEIELEQVLDECRKYLESDKV